MNNRIKIEGKGEPVVLVHGMGGPKIWSPVITALKEKFQLIIPTFPGFLSEDVDFVYSDELYVDFLIDLRKHLKIEKWNVIGISMGGLTSLNYALKESNHISTLTLIDSIGVDYMSPILKLPLINKIFPGIIKGMLKSESSRFKLAKQDFVNQNGKACKECVEWFSEMVESKTVRSNFAQILASVGRPQKQWKKELSNLNLTVQILWASDDQTAPLAWGKWLNSKITGSTLKIINGYKHMAILEKPDFFTDAILDFISQKNQ